VVDGTKYPIGNDDEAMLTLPSPGAEAKARESKVCDNLYVGST
jgi:hypothetical protein